jgi:hypothetical protein
MMHSYLHKGQDPWKVIKAKFAAWVWLEISLCTLN